VRFRRAEFARAQALQTLDEGESFGELRETSFFGLELRRVNATAQAAGSHWMFKVKHLVVQQILDGVARAGRAVEYTADDDGVVSRVVMAERTLGVVLAPCEVGATEQPAEEFCVERVENLIEIKEAALGAKVALAAASMADQLRLSRDGGGRGEALVAQIVHGIDWFAIKLGKKNVRDGVQDRLGRTLEQIGEAGKDLALAKANGGVERGEAPEADVDGRHGRARAKGSVL
jgi:hypothetical protein